MSKRSSRSSAFSALRKIFFHLVTITVVLILGPQSISNAQTVLELDEAITFMQASKDAQGANEGNHLQSLVYDLHKSLYLNDGKIENPLGGRPVCIYTDVSSISKLYEEDIRFSSIELITILLENPKDVVASINPEALQGFSDLKYILFLSKFQLCENQSYDCEVQIIERMIQPDINQNVQFFYKVATAN